MSVWFGEIGIGNCRLKVFLIVWESCVWRCVYIRGICRKRWNGGSYGWEWLYIFDVGFNEIFYVKRMFKIWLIDFNGWDIVVNCIVFCYVSWVMCGIFGFVCDKFG